MKTIYFTIAIFLMFVQVGLSQSFPQTFSYQAVARNNEGSPVKNKQIVVEITIIQGADCESNTGCNTIWQELHFPTTNEYGLFSINIGNGQNTFAGSLSNFTDIKWNDFSQGNYFLKLRVDFGNTDFGNSMIDMGIVKFQSVPYSFSSSKALDLERQDNKVPIKLTELSDINISSLSINQVLSWDGTNWVNKTVSGSSGGVTTLAELSDVAVSSPIVKQALVYDGSKWANTMLSTDNLSDISITSAIDGQALVYSGGNWINQTIAGGGSVWTEDANNIYYNGNKKVGIGTSTPSQTFELQLTEGNSFLVSGEYMSSSESPSLGAGTRMSFVASKNAFRAGTVSGTQWDNSNTGYNSVAFGVDNTASANFSFVSGKKNIANGIYATAFGNTNTASGLSSFAIGNKNTAVGMNSFVCGIENNQSSSIVGDNSIVAGSKNNGNSTSSLTIGENNTNSGNNSLVLGNNSRTGANATGSIAAGNNTYASGNLSVAFGQNTRASAYGSLVLGRFNAINGDGANWVAEDPIFVIGNGTSATNKHNALVIRKDGNIYTTGQIFSNTTDPTKSQKVLNFGNILKLNAMCETYKNSKKYALNPKQVQQFFPDLVSDFNDGKAINYIGFVPLIIETMKYQQAKIEKLENENKMLKDKLNSFEERLSKLENK